MHNALHNRAASEYSEKPCEFRFGAAVDAFAKRSEVINRASEPSLTQMLYRFDYFGYLEVFERRHCHRSQPDKFIQAQSFTMLSIAGFVPSIDKATSQVVTNEKRQAQDSLEPAAFH